MKNSHEIRKQEINLNGHIFAKGIENYHSVSIYNVYFRSGNLKGVALTETWLLCVLQFQSVALITSGYSYIGAKANINIWNPRVEADDEYTTGQMWLRNGPYNDSDSIELGWMHDCRYLFLQVNPSVYGDRRTRLFIYWTVDSGKTLGCFDLLCPGFVQLSSEIALGAPIEPMSTTRGPQYQIPVEVIKVNFIIKTKYIFICSKITYIVPRF
ncbi:putative neprosin [Dioscorea sansibarensis]